MRMRLAGAATALLILSLPSTASAALPDSLIQRKTEIERASAEQRAQQRRLARERLEKPPKIEQRLEQRKPQPKGVRRVSQRVRRSAAVKLEERRNASRRAAQSERTGTALPQAHSPSLSIGEIRRGILEAVNRERAKVGLPPLTLHTTLNASAQAYAEDMLRRQFFSHESPEGQGPQERIRSAGYGNLDISTCGCRWFRAAYGENLAMGQDSVEEVMRQWMASPKHRDNILSVFFTQLGIGYAAPYWVQHFGDIQMESY